MNTNFSHYDHFSAAQFAADTYFQQWVIFPLPEDEQYWNNYFEQHPDQQETILLARNLVRHGHQVESFAPLEAEEKRLLKQQILQQVNPAESTLRSRSRLIPRLLVAAAVAGGLVLLAANFLSNPAPEKLYQIVEKTGLGETKTVKLADSSVVILNANSTLTYSSNIAAAASREVRLDGNAFFNISKKADHTPFLVHTNSIDISVLGTTFNVNARSAAAEVVLTTGIVKVSDDQKKLQAIEMVPGDKVSFDPARQAFTKTATDTRLYQAWTDQKWNFSSTTLAEITRLINAYYGVETRFNDPKLMNLRINGVIPVTDLKSFTNIIAKTLDIKIRLQNNELIIQH